MTIFKRGSIYWYDFWFRGERYTESTKCRVKREAEIVQNAKKTELAKAEVGIVARKRAPVPRFDVAMNLFLQWSEVEHADNPATTRRYKISSKALLEYFGEYKLNQIDSAAVESFKDWRRIQKAMPKRAKHVTPKATARLKPATVNRELACLKALFFHFIKRKIIAENPVTEVKRLEESSSFRVLTAEEEICYLRECSQPLKDIATLMLETGMRPEEIYRMRIGSLRLAEGFYFNAEGKTKAARRRVPLTRRAISLIVERLTLISGGDFLFPGEVKGKPIVKVNAAHTGALRRCKLPYFRLYDLRHTFATRFIESGGDLRTLAEILGHSDLRMLMVYSHPTDPHKRSAITKFEDFNMKQRRNVGEGEESSPNNFPTLRSLASS